jgi:hypothetical protein
MEGLYMDSEELELISKEMTRKMENAIYLLEAIAVGRNKNREKSKIDYGLLLDAHLSVTSVFGTLLFKYNMKPGFTNEAISGKLSLIASFIQGIDLCETSISEGLYAQAANLLKQELETVAAIEEYKVGERMDGITPNVKHVKWNLKKVYGDLNKVAHVSFKDYFQPLYQGEMYGHAVPVSIVPIYNKEIARNLYALHIALLINLAYLLIDTHEEIYNEKPSSVEYQMLIGAVKMMEDEGFLGEINIL